MSNFTLSFHGAQIQGARQYQEDAFACEAIDDGVALLVADGLGGHSHGALASRQCVAAVMTDLGTHSYALPADAAQVLAYAVDGAQNALELLIQRMRRGGIRCDMATTLVALYATAGAYCWASVGDSYIYLVRGGRLSVLNPLQETPLGGLTSALGAYFAGALYSDGMQPLRPGDRLLLASDGISTLPDWQILETVLAAHTPEAAVSSLLAAIKRADSPLQDNVTLVALFNGGTADP